MNYGCYNRWLLTSQCAHMEYIRHFILLEAFSNIAKESSNPIFFKKTYFTFYIRNMFSADIENNYHGFVPGDAHALRVRDYIKIIQTYTRNDFWSSKARVFILYLFSTLYKEKNNREKYNRKKVCWEILLFSLL